MISKLDGVCWHGLHRQFSLGEQIPRGYGTHRSRSINDATARHPKENQDAPNCTRYRRRSVSSSQEWPAPRRRRMRAGGMAINGRSSTGVNASGANTTIGVPTRSSGRCGRE
jgi:hypothetical protein